MMVLDDRISIFALILFKQDDGVMLVELIARSFGQV